MLCHMSHSAIPHHITSLNHHNCVYPYANAHTHTLKTIWIIEHSIRLWRDDDEMCVCDCVSMYSRNFCVDFAGLLSFQSSRCSQIYFYQCAVSIFLGFFYQFSHRPHHNTINHTVCVCLCTQPQYQFIEIIILNDWIHTQRQRETHGTGSY